MKKVFIIGGGASGLTAAIKASRNGNDVTIFEKNSKLGKKILVTGNGKCNYWNENQDLNNYHSSGDYKRIINQMNLVKAHAFLDSIGIIPYIKNGYYYPNSQQAISVVNALIDEVKNNGVKIIHEEVIDVKKIDQEFIVKTSEGTYKSDALIIATGGKAAPKTGSDGFGYKIAKEFGHNIIKPLPALVGLKVNNFNDNLSFKELAGIRFFGQAALMYDGEKIQNEYGEIQINDYGFSGIPIMQLSSKALRLKEESKDAYIDLSINYLPNITSDILSLRTLLKTQNRYLKNKNISQILDQLLNYKLSNYVLSKSNIDKNKKVDELSNDMLDLLCGYILSDTFEIISDNGFENSQTTSGGIDLNEVNLDTLESLKINNLYFCGEVLDVDGACGGYNLSFAWVSGLIAGDIK